MRLVTFDGRNGRRLGALVGAHILDLAAAGARLNRPLPADMQGLIEAGEAAWDRARETIIAAPEEDLLNPEDVKLRSPLPSPVRLRDCVMFVQHLENGLAKLGRTVHPLYYQQIIYFNCDHTHVYGPDDAIVWPRHSRVMDYELEWACVIGKTGLNVARENAAGHIFGFTIYNDWSARDTQMKVMEAGQGPAEGKDFANSLGPCIATVDEFADPYDLRMTARVNGETWSNGVTGSITHRFEDAIVQFSLDRTIVAGEVLGSGAVLNGCGAEIGRKLAFGDVVELEIEGIGVLRNTIAAPLT